MLLSSMSRLVTVSLALIVVPLLLFAGPAYAIDDMAHHVNGVLDTLNLDFAAINNAAVSNEETNRRRSSNRLSLPRDGDMPTRLNGILDTLSLDASAINNAVDSNEEEAAKEGKTAPQEGQPAQQVKTAQKLKAGKRPHSIGSSNSTRLSPRDDVPSTEQLLQSCPGGSIHNADRCTFEPNGDTGTVYQYLVSNAGENCSPDAQTDLKFNLRITDSSRDAYSFGVTIGSGLEEEGVGVKIENTATYEQGVTVTHDEVITVTVKPHSSTMLVAQTAYMRHYGRVRVNYGNRVGGHYIWYVPGSQDVPDKNDVVRTTVPVQCGQAPESVVKEWNADPTKRRFNS